MSVIKIEGIAHIRFTAPDLQKLQRFLIDIGLETWFAADGRLYGRGRNGVPFNYSAAQGNPS